MLAQVMRRASETWVHGTGSHLLGLLQGEGGSVAVPRSPEFGRLCTVLQPGSAPPVQSDFKWWLPVVIKSQYSEANCFTFE